MTTSNSSWERKFNNDPTADAKMCEHGLYPLRECFKCEKSRADWYEYRMARLYELQEKVEIQGLGFGRVLFFVYRMIECEGEGHIEYHAKRCLPGLREEDRDFINDDGLDAKKLAFARKVTKALKSGEGL